MSLFIRIYCYSMVLIWLFAIVFLTGCTFVTTNDGKFFTLGQAEIVACQEVCDGEGNEAQNCYKLETKGISGEFAAITKALFGWFPGW